MVSNLLCFVYILENIAKLHSETDFQYFNLHLKRVQNIISVAMKYHIISKFRRWSQTFEHFPSENFLVRSCEQLKASLWQDSNVACLVCVKSSSICTRINTCNNCAVKINNIVLKYVWSDKFTNFGVWFSSSAYFYREEVGKNP